MKLFSLAFLFLASAANAGVLSVVGSTGPYQTDAAVVHATSVTFVNTTTTTVQMSSYTFASANTWIYLATATLNGTYAGEDIFTSATVSIGSSGTSTSFCCGVYVNGSFPSGESYRCQMFSNVQSVMALTPILIGVGTTGSTKLSEVCSVSQVTVGVQQAWSVRISGLGL